MAREDGYENLVPINERTKEEQRRIQSEGGKASGAARRRKRSLKEAADIYLALAPTDTKIWNALSCAGVDVEDIDNQMAVIVGLTHKAMTGDARAAKVLIDLLGEDKKISERNEHLTASMELSDMSDEQLKEMIMQAEEVEDVQS